MPFKIIINIIIIIIIIFFRMRKLHCSVFIVLTIGALTLRRTVSLLQSHKTFLYLTKFSALGHHQDNVQYDKEEQENEAYIQPVITCTCYTNSHKRGLL